MQEYNNNVLINATAIDCKLVFDMINHKKSTYTKLFE